MKKLAFSLLSLSMVLAMTACSSPADNLQLEVTEITIEYGDALSLDPKEYLAEDTSEDILKDTKAEIFVVNEDDQKEKDPLETDGSDLEVGNYVLSLSYNDEIEDVAVTVEDTTAPEFKDFAETLSYEEGSEAVDLASLFTAEDLSDADISVEGTVDFNTVGEYKIKVTAKDQYENAVEKECTVTVTEKDVVVNTPNTSGGSGSSGNASKPSTNGGNSSTNSGSNSNTSTGSSSSGNTGGGSGGSTATQTPSNPSQYYPDKAQEVFNLINQERTNAGLPQLIWANDLTDLANTRAKEILTNFSHDGLNKYDPTYSLGEIICHTGGNFSSEYAMQLWMNSSGHRNEILNTANSAMASSVYFDGNSDQGYWVVIFK